MNTAKLRTTAAVAAAFTAISILFCACNDSKPVNGTAAQTTTAAAVTVSASSSAAQTQTSKVTSAATSCPAPEIKTTVPNRTSFPEKYTLVAAAKADKSYFNDAVFLGDSRLDDFVMYMDMPEGSDYADTGLNVTSAYTKEFIEVKGKQLTAMDALKMNKTFKKVYLMFGINEVDWPYLNVFIKDYVKIINDIKAINPNAIIYVQSIPPVTEKLDKESDIYKNKSILALNEMIKGMAEDNDVVFLDVASVLTDEKGCLPVYAAADGMHMGKKLCTQWFNFLLQNEAKPR